MTVGTYDQLVAADLRATTVDPSRMPRTCPAPDPTKVGLVIFKESYSEGISHGWNICHSEAISHHGDLYGVFQLVLGVSLYRWMVYKGKAD